MRLFILNEVIYEMYYFENAFWVLTNKNMLYKYGWNQFNKPIQSYDLSLIDKEQIGEELRMLDLLLYRRI